MAAICVQQLAVAYIMQRATRVDADDQSIALRLLCHLSQIGSMLLSRV